MHDVSQFVSEDSREPMERLRRVHLWKIADALGLSYPAGAPKTTMISLLKAHDVDVTQPIAGIQWRVTQGRTSDGMPNQEMYPVVPEHASARKGVNAEAVMAQRIAEKTQKEQEQEAFEKKRLEVLERDNERLKALEDENARLKQIIDDRLSALESRSASPLNEKEQTGPNAAQREYWKAYRQAKSMGLPVKRGMTRDEIETLIKEGREHDTSSSG